MCRYFSPADIMTVYRVKRTTAFNLLNEYEKAGGEVIRIGKLRRVQEEQFTAFLKGRSNEKKP